MCRVEQARMSGKARVPSGGLAALALAAWSLVACTGSYSPSDIFSSSQPTAPATQPANQIGAGQVKVGLILPLSAPGNAGTTAQSMRNAAELALSEFNNPNITLLVKDDAVIAPGA